MHQPHTSTDLNHADRSPAGGPASVNGPVHRRPWLRIATVLACCVVAVSVTSDLIGQSKKKTSTSKTKEVQLSPADMKALELKIQQARESFIRDTVDAAKALEDAGLLEESKALLQTVAKVDDKLPGLDEKIKSIEETILSDNPAELELDTSKNWAEPVARVRSGKPFRIQAAGAYRFNVSTAVGPAGFPTSDPVREMTKGATCGALIAVIVPIDDKGKPGKPGPPVEVGEAKEITPKEDGLLFLGVNAPPGHRCTGKLDIQLTGYIATGQ